MWQTADGVFHTVALPEPGEVFEHDAVERLVSLSRRRRRRLQRLVQRLADELVENAYHFDPEVEEGFVATTPPVGLVQGDLFSEDLIRASLAKVPLRWKLDVLIALEELTD